MKVINLDKENGQAEILSESEEEANYTTGEIIKTDMGNYVVLKRVYTCDGVRYLSVTTDPLFNYTKF